MPGVDYELPSREVKKAYWVNYTGLSVSEYQKKLQKTNLDYMGGGGWGGFGGCFREASGRGCGLGGGGGAGTGSVLGGWGGGGRG